MDWRRLRILFAIGLVLSVIVSLVLGATVNLNGIVISAFGLFVIPRTILQVFFSICNNFYMGWLSRRYLIATLRAHKAKLPWGGLFMDYPKWRAKLFELNPGLEGHWKNVVALSTPIHRTWGVEVPAHGLSVEELTETVVSVLEQSLPNLTVFVTGLNQPTNQALIQGAHNMAWWLNDPRIRIVELPRAGKRGAMDMGFDIIALSDCYYTVNVDGDTRLDPDAIYTGVMLIESGYADAVTSNVQVSNGDVNLLTKLTQQRYSYSNLRERSAQSWVGFIMLFLWWLGFVKKVQAGVTCMSGPLMIMKTENVRKITPEWAHETFLGVEIGPGDDRSMTMHHLKRGLSVAFSPDSYVWTDCPSTMPKWESQQLRWTRSGMREFLRSLPWMHKMPLWSILDSFYLMIFPFILGVIVGVLPAHFLREAVQHDVVAAGSSILEYFVIIAVVNFINAGIEVIRMRNLSYFLSAFYVFFHFRYLLWIKIKALFSLPESAWLTRG